MGKLQPNFSWQKYERDSEDAMDQFQYQLQSEHIQVSNSVNATIDDESFFTRERQTSFTWVDGKPIWTKTISGVLVGTAITTYAHGIKGISTLVDIIATAQTAIPFSSVGITLPFVNPNNASDNVGIYIDTVNLVITTGDGIFNGYPFYATIKYTKV